MVGTPSLIHMAREAALFRVHGPRGIYYAVYESEQQSLFTEANEKGARDHAAELGLVLSRERVIQHAELMRLTGRDAPPSKTPSEKPARKPEKSANRVDRPLEARLPRAEEASSNQILSSRHLGNVNPFASAQPVEAEGAEPKGEASASLELFPSDELNRDVINHAQTPRTGRRGNPFADHSQK